MFLAQTALLLSLSPFIEGEAWFAPTCKDTGSEIVIHVTTETRNAMCPLIIEKCRVIPPFNGKRGLLDLHVMTDPHGICLYAFGPHQGSFRFPKGSDFPLGEYEFWLNGTFSGILHCQDEDSYLGGSE